MSTTLSVEMMDREAGELPKPNDRIIAFSPDSQDPTMKYRLMDGLFFRICGDARYWFSLSDLAIEEFHNIKMGDS